MSNNIFLALTTLSIGAAAYFAVASLLLRRTYKHGMTRTEQMAAEIAENERIDERGGPMQRVARFLTGRGVDADPVPVLAAGIFVYLISIVAVRILGFPLMSSIIVGIPVSSMTAVGAARFFENRRRRAFNVQLIPALNLVATQLETGVSPQRAFEIVTPSLSQPLRGEFEKVNTAAEVQEFTEAAELLRERFSSRTVDLFLSALKFNRRTGGSLAPVIREAAAIMEREVALSQEAEAEISQVKGEFFGILGIISLITFSVVAGGDATTRESLLSPTGSLIVGALTVNALFGVKRALKKFDAAKGGN